MLYVGANDGMLHAFNATNTRRAAARPGRSSPARCCPTSTAWPIPDTPKATPTLSTARRQYGDVFDKHATVGSDLCSTVTTAGLAKDCWKTILVGGYGAGGRGYYAMDITTPASPKALWEFNWSDTCYDSSVPATHSADCHIGLTFGAAADHQAGRRQLGRAGAASGLNNVNAPAKAGDGKGYLYVLDAITGKILKKISTGVGSAASGFGGPVGHADPQRNCGRHR
jgi:type IV pilus assembly protein PilY1